MQRSQAAAPKNPGEPVLEAACAIPRHTLALTAPKAEIHVHLEGALEPEMLFAFAARNGVPLAHSTPAALRAAYRFRNLQEFLNMYYAGLRVLQTERDFYELTAGYLDRARQDQVVHAEVFVSPQAHLRRGVPAEVIMGGILAAFADARREHGTTGGLILGAQRHLPEDDALSMLDALAPWHGEVLGLGLGGAEVGNPPGKFVRLFARARSLGWKTMAHAGEEGPARYVADSVDLLHVDRVDHGVRCEEDPALVARLAERRIPLTVCPLSNVMLRVFPDLAHHNIGRLLRAGLCVTINSDDPPYFGGYINDNLRETAAALNLTLVEQRQLVANGFEAAFLDAATRARYLQALDAHFGGNA
jgi:adenosine deaminase